MRQRSATALSVRGHRRTSSRRTLPAWCLVPPPIDEAEAAGTPDSRATPNASDERRRSGRSGADTASGSVAVDAEVREVVHRLGHRPNPGSRTTGSPPGSGWDQGLIDEGPEPAGQIQSATRKPLPCDDPGPRGAERREEEQAGPSAQCARGHQRTSSPCTPPVTPAAP